MSLALTNKTQSAVPIVPWPKIKRNVIGDKYELSLVFVGDGIMKKLNKRRNKKNKTTNVLSFPLSKNLGEIFINLSYIKKEAKKNKIDFLKHVSYLYIHSLLHLKGLKHGKKMEKEEIYYAQHRSRP